MNYTQTPNLLSDALERAYCHAFATEQQPLDIGRGLRKLGKFMKRAGSAFIRSSARVINAQAEARARSQRFTGTAW